MELSEWVRKDMTRYIKQYEKKDPNKDTFRPEDSAQISQIDYLQRIETAMRSNRLHEAKRLFDELKVKLHQIPESHKEERKRTYQMLQKAYRRIYDFVEDKHKTRKILEQAQVIVDVFDSSVPSQMHSEDEVTNKMPVDFSKPEDQSGGGHRAIIRHHKGTPPSGAMGGSGAPQQNSSQMTSGQEGAGQMPPPSYTQPSPTIQIQNQQQPKTAREYLAYLKTHGMQNQQNQMNTGTAPVNIINITPNQLEDAPLDDLTKSSVADQLGMSREEHKSHLPGFEPMKLHEDISKSRKQMPLPPPPMNPNMTAPPGEKPHESTTLSKPIDAEPMQNEAPKMPFPPQNQPMPPQSPEPKIQKPMSPPAQETSMPIPQQAPTQIPQKTIQATTTPPQQATPMPQPQAPVTPQPAVSQPLQAAPQPQAPPMPMPAPTPQTVAPKSQAIAAPAPKPQGYVPPSPKPQPRILRKQVEEKVPTPQTQQLAPRPMPPPLPTPMPTQHPAVEHVQRAKQNISRNEIEKAQQNLLSARQYLHRQPSVPVKKQIEEAEQKVAQKIPARRKEPNDGELFSNLYLKGIHALNNQDYQSAARYFQQRVQQAPGDRAARIRLYETLEAINGTNA